MALARGAFTPGGAAVAAPGGAYAYGDSAGLGSPQSQYYAGDFMIDTGYDDPVAWAGGVEAAEVYGARVYVNSMGHNLGLVGGGAQICEWRIVATPVWAADYIDGTGVAVNRRILINCAVYMSNPWTRLDTKWYRVDGVDWSLYRV